MIRVRSVLWENLMIEHPNSLLVHHCLQAANEGDRQTLRALWAPDIVWHLKGIGPFQGDIKGADNVFEYLAQIGEIGAGGLRTEIEDVMVSNERAAMICHAYAEIDDRVLDADFLVIANINSRRIQELTTVPIDPDRVADFWVF
jgi:ketosteroid isomerase-like protein